MTHDDAGRPASLADRALLVAYHLEKKKLAGSHREELVLAAALVDLTRQGALTDEGGKAVVTGKRTGDPMLDAVLDRIAASRRPRSWQHWATKDHAVTYRAVRDRLAERRVIAVTERRILGLFGVTDVSVRDTRIVRALVADLRRAVLGGIPADRLDPRDTDLVALVCAVEFNTVFSGRERREHRERVAGFALAAGPAARGLRKAIESEQVSSAAAAAT